MQNHHEVVITGAGVVTPLGLTLDSYWNSLRNSQSALECAHFETSVGPRSYYTASVQGFDPKTCVQPRKTIKLICQETQFAFGAAMAACNQAGIQAGVIAPERLSVCFGGEMVFSEVGEVQDLIKLCTQGTNFEYSKWAALFMSNIYPLWMLKSLPNMAACHVGIALDARGPVNTITNDEISSLMAMHEAFLLLQRGAADAVVVGACSSYINSTRLLQAPSEHYMVEQSDAPNPIKPFDKERRGMGRGQGAGCIVLERGDHARARGAKILGKLCSVASGFGKPIQYRTGSARSIHDTLAMAVQRAGVKSQDLDHVNTGAGGSVTLDAAIGNGVGEFDKDIPMVAVQAGMGNLGVATGLCELIASIAGAQLEQASPHTVNFSKPDPMICGTVQSEPGRKMQRPYVAKVSQTPHGQTAALVVQLLDL